MSRCHEWHSTWEGIVNYIAKEGIEVNPNHLWVETKIVNRYCKENKILGSFSDRILEIGKDFKSFKKYIETLKQTFNGKNTENNKRRH